MAHGDYKCCSICDSEQEYIGFNDSFKDDICSSCREVTGVATVEQLLKKIEGFKTKKELKLWLKEVELSECYYQNDIDDMIAFKLKGKVPDKFKSSTEWLKAIGTMERFN